MAGRTLAVPPQPHGPLAQPAGAAVVLHASPRPSPIAATYADARRLIRLGFPDRARAMLSSFAAAGGPGAGLAAAWAGSEALGAGVGGGA